MSDGLLPEGALLLDDRFRVVRQLGQGGMGVVDRGAQPGMVERFRREAQLQSSDCGMRNLAARRLGDPKNSEAVPALEALRELPRRKGAFSNDDCGQTQAANAVRAIRTDQL